jgi:peptidoglycan-associated lipoprotein
MRIQIVLATALALTASTACSHKTIKPDTGGGGGVPVIGNRSGNPELNRVHFDFDKSELTEVAKNTLRKDAAALQQEPALKFQIDGFCDERGGEKYNLALGQRRAEAVRSFLKGLGISDARISILSYGKSHPLDSSRTEEAYALNRRAEFVIQDSGQGSGPKVSMN